MSSSRVSLRILPCVSQDISILSQILLTQINLFHLVLTLYSYFSYRLSYPGESTALRLSNLPACQLPAPQHRVVLLSQGGHTGLHA